MGPELRTEISRFVARGSAEAAVSGRVGRTGTRRMLRNPRPFREPTER